MESEQMLIINSGRSCIKSSGKTTVPDRCPARRKAKGKSSKTATGKTPFNTADVVSVKKEILQATDSSAHSFHPLVLFAGLLLFSILVFMSDTLFFQFLALAIVVSLLVANDLTGEDLRKKSRGLWNIVLFVVIVHTLFSRPSRIFIINIPQNIPLLGGAGLFDIYGIYKGIILGLRILTLYWAALVFTHRVRPDNFILSMRKAGLPFEIALVLDISIRLVPQLQQTFYDLKMMQEAKGIVPSKNPLKNLFRLAKLLAPLVISQIIHARNMSIAIYSRGFRPGETRTSLYEIRISKKDILLLLLFLCGSTLWFALYLYKEWVIEKTNFNIIGI
ncbi:MAG: energy-coupling factor transporter transmembrane component T [Thermoplasmata archaeon]